MRRVSIVLFAMIPVGICLALVYFYVLLFSGTQIHSQEVFKIPEMLVSRAASKAHKDPENYKPVELKLHPDMNPISVLYGATRKKRVGTGQYEVQIKDADGQKIESFEMLVKNDQSGTGGGTMTGLYFLGRFNVQHEGTYSITVKPVQIGVSIVRLDLRFRRNSRQPNLGLLIGGIFIGFIGMGGGILSVVIGKSIQFSDGSESSKSSD